MNKNIYNINIKFKDKNFYDLLNYFKDRKKD